MISQRNWLNRIKTVFITRKKYFSSKFWPFKSEPDSLFIILCQPRTGSTLIHTLLNSHPNIYSYGEVLRRRKAKSKVTNLNEYVFNKHPHFIKAVGLKIFYSYSTNTDFSNHFQEIAQNDAIKVIHLTRENTLDEFVSLKKAELSNNWSSVKDDVKTSSSPINISIEEFKEYLATSYKLKQFVTNFFCNHYCLEVTYEMLINNQEETLIKIQEFLGINPKKLFSLLKKQGHSNHKSISNYDILKRIYEDYQ